MQIVPFPAYYQSVYTNFDFTSFSLISCTTKIGCFAFAFHSYCFLIIKKYCALLANLGLLHHQKKDWERLLEELMESPPNQE